MEYGIGVLIGVLLVAVFALGWNSRVPLVLFCLGMVGGGKDSLAVVPLEDLHGIWQSINGDRAIYESPNPIYDLTVSGIGGSGNEYLLRYDEENFDFYDPSETWVANAVLGVSPDQYSLVFTFDGYQETWTLDRPDENNSTGDSDDDVPTLLLILDQLQVIAGHTVATDQLNDEPKRSMHELIVDTHTDENGTVDFVPAWDSGSGMVKDDFLGDEASTTFTRTRSAMEDFRIQVLSSLGMELMFESVGGGGDMPNYQIINGHPVLGDVGVDLGDGAFTVIIGVFKIGFTAVCLWFIGWWVVDKLTLQIAA